MQRAPWLIVMIAATLVAGTASANNAYTQGNVHLRAGPSAEYPLVTSIAPNSLLNVNGCLDDYSWCDVDWEGNRGWVYGNYLYYDYQDRRVPILQFGASLGIGIVAFSIGDYWGRYYAGRPWYGRQSYWAHRPPPPRRPRPPPPRPVGPGPRPPPRPQPPPRPRPPPNRPSPGRPSPGRPSPGQPGAGGPGGGGGRPGSSKPAPGKPSPGQPGAGQPSPGRPNNGGRPAPNRPGNGGGDRPQQPDRGSSGLKSSER
jgi:uncharacterized protein YraI